MAPYFWAALRRRRVDAEVHWEGGSTSDDAPDLRLSRGRVYAILGPPTGGAGVRQYLTGTVNWLTGYSRGDTRPITTE
jgi:hypothetical protein